MTTLTTTETTRLETLLSNYVNQVNKGGHYQYYSNGCDTNGNGCFGANVEELTLHNEMINLFEMSELSNSESGINLLKIMKRFNIELDNKQFFEDWENDNEEITNDNYQKPTMDCEEKWNTLDDALYSIINEFMIEFDKMFNNDEEVTTKVELSDMEQQLVNKIINQQEEIVKLQNDKLEAMKLAVANDDLKSLMNL